MTVVLAADEVGALERAAAAVEQGAVIGVPTDTVYGLVCLCRDAAAIDRLFAVKERPSHKALPVLLGDAEQVRAVVRGAGGPVAQALIERYWPGPLTLVLPARSHLPVALTAGGETVGVRVPAQPFLRALARRVGPLASSSANRSGALHPPPCATPAAGPGQHRAGPTGRTHPSPHRRRPGPPGPGQHRAGPERTAAKTAARRADWPGSTGRSQDTRRSNQ